MISVFIYLVECQRTFSFVLLLYYLPIYYNYPDHRKRMESEVLGEKKILYQNVRRNVSSDFYGEAQSHQYEVDESEVWKHHQLQRHFEDKGHWWTFAKKREVRRWSLTLATGFCCGVVAIFVTFFTKLITRFKLSIFYDLLEKEKKGDLHYGTAFLFFFCCNFVFVFLAWLAVYIEPLASGSGIPEVKCFLNGLNIPRIVNLNTLICKVFGIVFSCSSGLPLGKEGPMIHAGAVIAAGVSQGKGALGFDTAFNKNQDFRNDKEKRDFVACGAAAGVAAAFGAPIGGVLFSLEEGASFWSTKLTWRCFFCAMTTVFTVYVINTANSAFGHSDNTAMFSFGEFFSLKGETSNYSVWELSLFTLLGCMGGAIGACFVGVNLYITQRRFGKTHHGRRPRASDALAVVTMMSIISFLLPVLWNRCTPLPLDMEEWSDQEKSLVDDLVSFYCPDKSHYNELASLYLTDSDTAIKQLFHFREIGDHNDSTFSSFALFLFVVPYTIMACITLGTPVPSGLFVPSLLSGAAFGRLVGHLLHRLDNTRGTFADSGTYALMGAAAITAGIARMTISLTVMILEGTGDMQYVLPLMLVVMAARLAGNVFTEGQYDVHIHSRHLNFLDEDEGVSHLAELHDLTVSDIMTKLPVCLRPVVRVGDVFDMLKMVKHHCFPIVDGKNEDVLVGTITRKVICTLIKHKAFGPASSDPTSARRISPLVNWGTLECIYPDYPEVEELSVTDLERSLWIDLRPYIDCAPYTIYEHASIQRTYRMFRTLGLRHLCVINKHNQSLGIITRADLVAAHMLRNSKREGDERRRKKDRLRYIQHTIDLLGRGASTDADIVDALNHRL